MVCELLLCPSPGETFFPNYVSERGLQVAAASGLAWHSPKGSTLYSASLNNLLFRLGMQENGITAVNDFIPADGETVLATGSGFVVTNLRVIQDKDKNGVQWQFHARHIDRVLKNKVSQRIGGIKFEWQVIIFGASFTAGWTTLWVRDEAEADALLAALAVASSNAYRAAAAR